MGLGDARVAPNGERQLRGQLRQGSFFSLRHQEGANLPPSIVRIYFAHSLTDSTGVDRWDPDEKRRGWPIVALGTFGSNHILKIRPIKHRGDPLFAHLQTRTRNTHLNRTKPIKGLRNEARRFGSGEEAHTALTF